MRKSATVLGRTTINDRLNGPSSMTLGSKGLVLRPLAHRVRMPWIAAAEPVPRRVLLRKDKALLDGTAIREADALDRMSQADPLDVLKAAVAQHKYTVSNGKNIFQLASSVPFDGRGQKIYRKEWMEGTYEKYVTLSAVEYNRDGNSGAAYGYVTFHGETTLTPIRIKHDDIPGWVMAFDEKKAVPYDRLVPPPPSIGTEVPVNPKQYRLKAYPFYDPPNPSQYVEQLLRDRGVLPDAPEAESGEPGRQPMIENREEEDGSVHVELH